LSTRSHCPWSLSITAPSILPHTCHRRHCPHTLTFHIHGHCRSLHHGHPNCHTLTDHSQCRHCPPTLTPLGLCGSLHHPYCHTLTVHCHCRHCPPTLTAHGHCVITVLPYFHTLTLQCHCRLFTRLTAHGHCVITAPSILPHTHSPLSLSTVRTSYSTWSLCDTATHSLSIVIVDCSHAFQP
jgi:hypothetical protein